MKNIKYLLSFLLLSAFIVMYVSTAASSTNETNYKTASSTVIIHSGSNLCGCMVPQGGGDPIPFCTNGNGEAELKNVPAGTYNICVNGSGGGYITDYVIDTAGEYNVVVNNSVPCSCP